MYNVINDVGKHVPPALAHTVDDKSLATPQTVGREVPQPGCDENASDKKQQNRGSPTVSGSVRESIAEPKRAGSWSEPNLFGPIRL